MITRQQMDDQGSKSVGDVLRNTPGVSAQKYDSDRTEFSARGFAITNFQYDGVNSLTTASTVKTRTTATTPPAWIGSKSSRARPA